MFTISTYKPKLTVSGKVFRMWSDVEDVVVTKGVVLVAPFASHRNTVIQTHRQVLHPFLDLGFPARFLFSFSMTSYHESAKVKLIK